MTFMRWSVAAAIAGAATVASGAQTPASRESAATVHVYVAVTTRDGKPVEDLQVTDFMVLSDGQAAGIASFQRAGGPPAIRVLVDDSLRMGRHRRSVERAGAALAQSWRAGSAASVAAYTCCTSPWTEDPVEFESKLETLLDHPSAAAAREQKSWPGLEAARVAFASARRGSSADPGMRAVILFSAGMDWYPPDMVQAHKRAVVEGLRGAYDWPPTRDRDDRIAAQVIRDNIVVFGFGLEGAEADERLQRLSQRSGGWFVEPRASTNWAAEMTRIISDLHGRYLLGITPPALDGRDHDLEIRVKRSGTVVRARASYRAPSR